MSRTPTSVLRFAGVACAAALLLASCGDSANTSAASVNGVAVNQQTLEVTLTQLSEAGQIELQGGVIPMDATRSVLVAMIRGEATTQILAKFKINITDEDTQTVIDQVSQDAGYDTLGEELKQLIIGLNSGDLALSRVKAPTATEIETMYNEAPVSLGAVCAQHILVEEEATAREVIDLLNDGGNFKELAGEYSTEPNAAETGGILGSVDGDCILLTDYQSQFDAAFTAGALGAKVGVPTGPVKSSFGYHVILIRPFDDIKASLQFLLSKTPGEMLMTGYLATTPVDVASQYGRWDTATGRIVDL